MTRRLQSSDQRPTFVVEAQPFAKVLQRLRPKGRKVGSRNYPAYLSITAGGNVVVLLSEIDCSASIPAVVKDGGTGKIPHEPVLRVMKTFPKGATVEIRVADDCVWLNNLRLPMSQVK